MAPLFDRYVRQELEQAGADGRLFPRSLDPRRSMLELDGVPVSLIDEADLPEVGRHTTLLRRLRNARALLEAFPLRGAVEVTVTPPDDLGFGGDLMARVTVIRLVPRRGFVTTSADLPLALQPSLDVERSAFRAHLATWQAQCEAAMAAATGNPQPGAFTLGPPGDLAQSDRS
jgi:hypothetical protein